MRSVQNPPKALNGPSAQQGTCRRAAAENVVFQIVVGFAFGRRPVVFPLFAHSSYRRSPLLWEEGSCPFPLGKERTGGRTWYVTPHLTFGMCCAVHLRARCAQTTTARCGQGQRRLTRIMSHGGRSGNGCFDGYRGPPLMDGLAAGCRSVYCRPLTDCWLLLNPDANLDPGRRSLQACSWSCQLCHLF